MKTEKSNSTGYIKPLASMAKRHWEKELKKRTKAYEKQKNSWFLESGKILTGHRSAVNSAKKKLSSAKSFLSNKNVARSK